MQPVCSQNSIVDTSLEIAIYVKETDETRLIRVHESEMSFTKITFDGMCRNLYMLQDYENSALKSPKLSARIGRFIQQFSVVNNAEKG